MTRQKTSFSISLLSISHSIYKHDAIADPSSMQDACHELCRPRSPQSLSGSEVEHQSSFSVFALITKQKHLSVILDCLLANQDFFPLERLICRAVFQVFKFTLRIFLPLMNQVS